VLAGVLARPPGVMGLAGRMVVSEWP
jgi:hypothetical protein